MKLLTVSNDPTISATSLTASTSKLLEIINIDVPLVELGAVATNTMSKIKLLSTV